MELNVTRRHFLTTAAGMIAAARGASARISANDRIHVACIGVGGMGRAHFDRLLRHDQVRIIAAADPDAQRQQAAREKAAEAGQEVAAYTDFREMLDQHPGIDAVFVSTPDHWHALASIHCMRAGKDVYCEKPLALTIAEGRALVETARRFGRILQVGTMQRSDQPHFRHACELVRNGRIGTLQRVVCYFGGNPRHEPVPDAEPPPHLDWDLWLGPAPWRRYNPQIHPYNFRYFRDYSGGMLTDWGVHLFDIAQWGADRDHTGPSRIEAEDEMYAENLYEFPRRSNIRYEYEDGLVLEWRMGTQDLPEIEPGATYGTKFYGTEGEVFVNRDGHAARGRNGARLDEALGPAALRLQAATSHHGDFFEAMRTRKPPICDVAIGHRASSIAHLGNIASRLGRPVRFDPAREFFLDDEAANRMLAKPLRAPWRL